MRPGVEEITYKSAAHAPNPDFNDVTPFVPKLTTGFPVFAFIPKSKDPAVKNILLSFPDSQ